MATTTITNESATGNYAEVNGLRVYYEIHGTGEPLVLLHGAYMTIETMGDLVPRLAEARQVIAIEAQGHGHTADVDRPLTYEAMADDTAALLRHLGIERADVVGYSLGGATAIQLAVRHPNLVRKLVPISAGYRSDGMHPELLGMIESITPEMFAGSPWEDAYKASSPHPDAFPTLVEKLKTLDVTPFAWPDESIRAIAAPTLVIIGDSDATRPEHAVALFRLLGGGVMGDLAGLPTSQLAILPGTHHLGMLERVDWLMAIIVAFLDAPTAVAEPTDLALA